MNERTEHVENLSAQIVEWNAHIDDLLRYKADSTIPRDKNDYSYAITVLQFKRDEAALKLLGMSSASHGHWRRVQNRSKTCMGRGQGRYSYED